MRPRLLLALSLAPGCTVFSTERPEALPVTWRPFRLAHIAHPDLGTPGATARLQRAAERLRGDRWLDAIVVSGRLGTADPRQVAALLAPARRPIVAVQPDGPALDRTEPFRGLAILAVPAGAAERAAEALRATEATLRGRCGCVVLDRPLRAGPDAPRGEVSLAYALEAVERVRLVLVPAEANAVDRAAGLVTLATAPLAAGDVRVIAVRGHRLVTWLRPIDAPGDHSPDGPRTEAELR